jgi:hypothetical protein
MSIFTIFNPVTKHIAEEREFPHYIAANQYCKENYSEGYISKHEPFHFESNFREMLLEGTHPRIKTNRWGHKAAIIDSDGKTVLHCGGITLQEWVNMGAAGIKSQTITKVQFINLHNQLIREKELESAESFYF